MSAVLAALVASAVLLWSRPRRAAGRLVVVLRPGAAAAPTRPEAKAVIALAAGAAVMLVVIAGPLLGIVTGLLVVAVGWRPGGSRRLDVDLPLVADLVASCLSAGAGLPDALRAAADASARGRAACLTVADALQSGLPPEEAWASWLAEPELAPMARACVRGAGTGAATTREIRRASERVRSQRRAELARRAQRAGVWSVLPLGLCFLPAFVLVGIVPFALGLFAR